MNDYMTRYSHEKGVVSAEEDVDYEVDATLNTPKTLLIKEGGRAEYEALSDSALEQVLDLLKQPLIKGRNEGSQPDYYA